MAKPDVLIRSAIRPNQMQALEQAFTLHRLDKAADPAAFLTEVGPRIRGVVTNGGAAVGRDIIDHLPAVEIVATSSVGTDHLDLAAFAERGVVATNTPEVLNDDVADLALGLILTTHRRMIEADAWVRSRDWANEGAFPLTTALAHRRLGIVGLGGIGMAVAERAEAFKMEIGYTARGPKDVSYQHFDSPMTLAEWSDILVLCVPGSPETAGLVDAEVLNALGPGGILINIARGSVVDEPALVTALRDGLIAGAGLDVFADEPSPPTELLDLANVVLSPHHASGTVRTRDRMAQLVVDNLLNWFSDRATVSAVSFLTR